MARKKIHTYDEKGIDKSMSMTGRRIIAHTVLVFLTLLCLFWFYMLFINCTRTNAEISQGFSWVPGSNFVKNWTNLKNGAIDIFAGLRNSAIVAVVSAGLCVYFSTLTAFAIHAYNFPGKNVIYTFILMVMMIPTQVTSLGFVKLCRDIGLENSFLPVILPSIAAPITFFYLKQYMDSSLSLSLIEAARIDGSSELRTFNRIVVPLMKPAIAVQAIFTFVSSWNNYYVPALLLTKEEKKTLPILIAQLRASDWQTFDMGKVYMCIAFSIFPVVIVYLLLSKFIVAGVALGGVKE